MMHACVVHEEGDDAGRLLLADTYRGFRLMPTVRAGGFFVPLRGGPPDLGDRSAVEGTPEQYWRDDWNVFWQVVFHGLLVESGPALCEGCGALLGRKTRTGRDKKQRWCGKCRYRKWAVKQPKKKMRAKWRADKKNQLQE